MFIIYFPQCLKGVGDICSILFVSVFGAELTKQDMSNIFFPPENLEYSLKVNIIRYVFKDKMHF